MLGACARSSLPSSPRSSPVPLVAVARSRNSSLPPASRVSRLTVGPISFASALCAKASRGASIIKAGRNALNQLLAALLACWAPLAAGGGEDCFPRPGALCRERDLRGAQLRGVDLRIADLSRSDLSGADLSGANLRNADLDGAVLRGADLTGANLADADLRSADLRGAIVEGANFAGADMRGCRGCPPPVAAEDSAAEK